MIQREVTSQRQHMNNGVPFHFSLVLGLILSFHLPRLPKLHKLAHHSVAISLVAGRRCKHSVALLLTFALLYACN